MGVIRPGGCGTIAGMDLVDALERTYGHTETVIANIGPDDMGKPTPCEDWDVRTLLGHLVTVVQQFPVMLHGEAPDWGAVPPLDDPFGEFREAAATNLAAWREPGAAEQPSNMLPGMSMIDFNLCDAIVHTWDLAKATGQDPGLDGDVAEAVLDIWSDAPLDTGRQYGAFGEEVVVSPTARPLDRLVALLGREP
jgi:uncharacterized protein (TIGR03086 family)